MLTLKLIRQKNPKGFCKWEAETDKGAYVIIRFKNHTLDVRVAKTETDFILGKVRCLYRGVIESEDANYISLEKVIDILDLNMSV